ncbi:helix-turn-helix transcriptional regulator [Lysobacter sp. CFH 32150]|uniref:helix-turn-helix domain-containing protein n=1 Tax=Lysobacter sp. CFH 32150 TaxID=2927128 RepID=UPI001FA7DD25|nr:helix-turn-helix transcriptional regulator [Lysobacter sp. CFH 32150]MCI4568852.1 helix-turn-helix transcriptional regulator [Lysobacter sp. CFH 32150]
MDTIASHSSSPSTPAHVGVLLREWRAARRLSQLDLALDAGLSTRHLSCVETGKAQPSRDTIARLADALEMPLRERNALLMAAGYAPKYPETALATPEMAQVRRAIEFILAQQEPYPAFVLNRRWDILMANPAALRVNGFVMRGRASAHKNMIRQIFDPDDLRPAVANWDEVAGDLIRHLHDEVAAAPTDAAARALLDEVLAYPGVPTRWRTRELGTAPSPLLTTVLRRDHHELRFFSTITTFGTPRDVTIDELHIECCFPVDDATTELCRALARDDMQAG